MEHAVIIHISLSDRAFGSFEDRQAISQLEDQISSALDAVDVGDLDGDEYGQGECVIYIYGPDADVLFSIIEPLLTSGPTFFKGYAIKRYGEANDPLAREARVSW